MKKSDMVELMRKSLSDSALFRAGGYKMAAEVLLERMLKAGIGIPIASIQHYSEKFGYTYPKRRQWESEDE